VIVQDAGICRLIRQISPDIPIHASTQMTITSAAAWNLPVKLGCSLVVLAANVRSRKLEKFNRAR